VPAGAWADLAPMLALTLLVASIGIADSINPSTVVPALWLASAPRGRGLGSFTLGVFAVYLAGGIVLVFGPGPALIDALHQIRGPLEHVLLAAGGIAALAFAVVLWRSRVGEHAERKPRRMPTRTSAFTLGAGIMAVELPTAFVYFGAIVAILVVRRLAGDRADIWLASGEAWLRHAGRPVLTGAAGAGGAALVVIGVGGLLAT
jgi:hypothetical protein